MDKVVYNITKASQAMIRMIKKPPSITEIKVGLFIFQTCICMM